jgi:hypothetical protein
VHYVFGLGTLAYIALNIMLDIMNVLFAAHLALLPSLVGSPFMAFLVNTFLIVGCFTFFMGLDMPQSSALRQSEQPLGLVEKKFIESQRQSTWAFLSGWSRPLVGLNNLKMAYGIVFLVPANWLLAPVQYDFATFPCEHLLKALLIILIGKLMCNDLRDVKAAFH